MAKNDGLVFWSIITNSDIICKCTAHVYYNVKSQFRVYILFTSRGTEGVNLLHVKLKTATSIKLTHH